MNYNNGGMTGDELRGAGVWADPDQRLAYEIHNSRNPSLHPPTSSRSQQAYPASREPSTVQVTSTSGFAARRSAASVYTTPPIQNDIPYYNIPSTPPNVYQAPSYAAVAAGGQLFPSTSSSIASHPPQQQRHSSHQRAITTQQYRQPVEVARTSSNFNQRQPQQEPSWAQVAAGGQARPNQAFHRPTNDTLSGQPQPSQQYQPEMGQWPYGVPNTSGSLASLSFGNQPGAVAMDDTWPLGIDEDFPLYDDSEPYVPNGSLVINPTPAVAPAQLLMSPTNSIDASSMTSSNRRSKKEIMGGSGQHKCQYCPAGFMTPDDRRHHEDRVHLPYELRRYVCPTCEQRFVYLKDLNRHLPKHEERTANAQYFCEFANCKYAQKGFSRKDHLRRHLSTHYKPDSGIQMSRSTSGQTLY